MWVSLTNFQILGRGAHGVVYLGRGEVRSNIENAHELCHDCPVHF
jgi:hypothetical protein